MRLYELATAHEQYLRKNQLYKRVFFKDYDYSILHNNIIYTTRGGRSSNNTVNTVWIGADTETSKKPNREDNHIVAWSISIRAYQYNIVTLWGRSPDEFIECLDSILHNLKGKETIVYFHNLAYDWVFLRKFLIEKYGIPGKQLNTKSHYPILIKFCNGLIIKDSLILAQRSLDKWAKDMDVEHKKAVGYWDYYKLRNQDENYTKEELTYFCNDTLALVECLDATALSLHKTVLTMPYTATGIPREEVRKLGKVNNARNNFERQALDLEQYLIAEKVYHGGYTHANRHLIDFKITDNVKCFDFASSYPFVMLSEKYPAEKFTFISDKPITYILDRSQEYAFMFKLVIIKPKLSDYFFPMPTLQFSKCVECINPVIDNGRILYAEYVEIWLTETDLQVIEQHYTYESAICSSVMVARKEYLPRWFTDYIFKCYEAKTLLKGGDAVQYAIAKAKVNSLYGMCVQKCIKDDIHENYFTGEYDTLPVDKEESYEKYLKKFNTILPYQWGIWVTAYAFRNLFELGKCAGVWVYSDTDSCYGIEWNTELLQRYNESCKHKLVDNHYGCVNFNNREYWLGCAEFDGEYSEFKVMGAKRYCGRATNDNELHITVAGVPKKNGVKCLNNNIDNFTKHTIFKGEITGKLTHSYIYVDDIYKDEFGNITGDSINLSPCDYLLDSVDELNWEDLFNEEVEVQTYEE